MSELKLFIDDVPVKRGDKIFSSLVNGDPLYIVFDYVDSDGYVRSVNGGAYVSYRWEFDRRDGANLSIEQRLKKLKEKDLMCGGQNFKSVLDVIGDNPAPKEPPTSGYHSHHYHVFIPPSKIIQDIFRAKLEEESKKHNCAEGMDNRSLELLLNSVIEYLDNKIGG